MSVSLQRRIRRSLLLTLVCVMIALLLLADQGVKRLTEDYIRSRLQHDADSLLSALTLTPAGQWQIDTNRLPSFYQRVRSGHYYQLISGPQRLASRSLWDTTVDIKPLPVGEARSEVRQVGDEHWLMWAQGVSDRGKALTLWVAEDIAPLEAERRRFSIYMGLLLAATLMALMLLQHWILRRGFAPLEGIRERIRTLRFDNPSAMRESVPEEIQPLAEEINGLLAQLDQRIRRSRNALGNLAHELKRPLQRLASLQKDVSDDTRKELEGVRNTMQTLLERELKRARIAGAPIPGRQFMPSQDIPVLIEVLQRIYPGISVIADVPEALTMRQDRDDMLELLGNLLDNACKFARAQVALHIARHDGGIRLTISDDGPGIEDTVLKRLMERGLRLDEAVEGHGLGLSICRDIVDSYGGNLTFACGPEGGLQATVALPA